MPRPVIRCSNILGTITAILVSLPSGLEGAKVTRIRTLARYLDAANFPGSVNPTADPTASFPEEIYYIDRKSNETRDVVEFELAAAFDLAGVRVPKRQCVSNICQWIYRSAECGYQENTYFDVNDNPVNSSSLDVCGKRLSSCQKRFSTFSANGSIINGSNQLTLTSTISADVGLPIAGFGLQPGTIINSVSTDGLVVTMNKNATANSTKTTTGTIQSNQTQLVVANASNMAIGMAVSGPNIPSGTTVSSISGTTVTLSQKANLISSLYATRSGIVAENAIAIDITGLSIGMLVTGTSLPNDYSVQIVNFESDWRYNYVVLSYDTKLINPISGTFNFYTIGSYTSQTYTFTGSPVYTFRNATDNALPFGSFPGIGTYFV